MDRKEGVSGRDVFLDILVYPQLLRSAQNGHCCTEWSWAKTTEPSHQRWGMLKPVIIAVVAYLSYFFSENLLLFSGEIVSDSFAMPQTLALQTPLSMGFSRHRYWSGLPFPFPGDSFWLRDGTCVSCISCISRCILYHWVTREAP